MNYSISHLRQWWMSLLSGILFTFLCLWIFIFKTDSYHSLLVVLLSCFAIVGLFRAFYAIFNKDKLDYWRMLLVNGLIEVGILGIPFIPSVSIEAVIPIYAGFILLYRSIIAGGVSFNFYYSKLSAWFIPFIFAILGVIASFFMIWEPVSNGVGFLLYSALTFLFVGIAQFGIAYGMKKLNDKLEDKTPRHFTKVAH